MEWRPAEKMFGYTPSEAVGWSFFSLTIQDDFESVIKNNLMAPVSAVTNAGANKPMEIVARQKTIVPSLQNWHCPGTISQVPFVHTCIFRDLP